MWFFNRINRNRFEKIKKEYREIKINECDISFYFDKKPVDVWSFANSPIFNLMYYNGEERESKRCYEWLDELRKEVKTAISHKNKKILAEIYYDLAKYTGQALAKMSYNEEKRLGFIQSFDQMLWLDTQCSVIDLPEYKTVSYEINALWQFITVANQIVSDIEKEFNVG